MDFESMLKLVNAGFTKDEILKMTQPTPTPEPQPTPTPEPQPTPTPEPKATQTGNENEIISQLTAQVTDLAKIVKDIQSNNVKNAKIDAPKETNALDAVKSFFGDVSIKEGK